MELVSPQSLTRYGVALACLENRKWNLERIVEPAPANEKSHELTPVSADFDVYHRLVLDISLVDNPRAVLSIDGTVAGTRALPAMPSADAVVIKLGVTYLKSLAGAWQVRIDDVKLKTQ